jgi:plastocyanin
MRDVGIGAHPGALSRREFALTAATGITVAAVGGLALSCSRSGANAIAAPGRGDVRGEVVDANEVLQPSLGRVTLFYDSGLRTGAFADTDATGHFLFTNLIPGRYQVRFDAPDVAHMLDDVPVPFTVQAGATANPRVHVARGPDDTSEVQVYIGDFFFQAQPFGVENGETVVHVGMEVCWYNIGAAIHTVTGGPWVDSGDMRRPDNFPWIADRVGVFGYRCKYHQGQMQATVRVLA